MITCATCGNPFPQRRDGTSEYCSVTCANKGRKQKSEDWDLREKLGISKDWMEFLNNLTIEINKIREENSK